MQAKAIFADNMAVVIGDNNVKELVRQARSAGISIDYTYVMDVRRGTTNPSLEKSEQIVQVLRLLPNHEWLEHWMFFIPDYFKQNTTNVLTDNKLSSSQFESMISELLVTACRLQFLSLDEKQFGQVQELAKYIFQKENEKNQLQAADKKPAPIVKEF
ncbi:hypothetical protein [Shewanella xiamenensis]|uniref:hypothetical protein n=1 Tax=Shewanella xiamenensis TaxID=332186 RepID=UPI002E7B08F2|nr:hypothetical protein [Shewanella xiamenensis]